MEIKFINQSVVYADCDAIVNAANRYLAPGAGVCGAVFRGAGYKELEEACRQKGEQAVGSATLTSGFNLNADYIINRLRDILASFGSPSENNESALTVEVGKLVAQLEIYDQACTVRNLKNAYRNTPDSDLHCTQGKELAKNFIAMLMENEGTGDSFPYSIVNELREGFGL